MTLTLVRRVVSDSGVLGELVIPVLGVRHTLVTQEDDWLNNRRGKSCIPAGTYPFRRTVYWKHGYETFEIICPPRQRILVHPGNTELDTEGCVLVGLRYGQFWVEDEDSSQNPKPKVWKAGVAESRPAFFDHFMKWMSGMDETTIVVEWAPGLP